MNDEQSLGFVQWLYDVSGYIGSSFLWQGALVAVQITALAMSIGLVLGLGLALMRLSHLWPVKAAAWVYIWIVRGTPQLLQLVFIFDALPLIGLRFDNFTAAVIGFSLNQAAFSAEIIRGGILSVSRNQSIAAASFGMGKALTLRRIILPQAMRAILPGITNDTIGMIKLTSVASIIFVNELTFRAQQIVGQNFRFFTVFAAAAAIYLLLTSVISIVQYYLERHYDLERDRPAKGTSVWQRGFGFDLFRKPESDMPAETVLVSAADRPAAPPAKAKRDKVPFAEILSPADNSAGQGQDFVTFQDVHKRYGNREILRGVDFAINRGEVVAIMGPSGSGKSTLLRLINHLEAMDEGEIKVGGRHIGYMMSNGRLKPVKNLAHARAESKIGMVFQHFNLFNHLTAKENVTEAPVRVHGMQQKQADQLAEKLLASVGLEAHFDHLPHRLSGGQQQRVAIARALAISPQLMLFDEPTSALDPELVGEVLNVMRGLADAGMTMVVVTHEVRFARDVADRVVFMDDGRIVEQGPPAVVIDNPSNERTKRFMRLVENG